MKPQLSLDNVKTILIAPDKFKGSMTAIEFCEIASKTILNRAPEMNIISVPLADGGEGSLDCFESLTNAKIITNQFSNANSEKIFAKYALINDVAFIELAETSGLTKTPNKNPCITTTLGMGEQILDAINHGAKKIFLSIGGSSTNDAGCGMACGVGYKFFDGAGKEFVPVGETLCDIKNIVAPNIDFDSIEFVTLCDVNNGLFGENGAAKVYAKQKGASRVQIELLDKNLQYFNTLCKKQGFDFENFAGAGAAGGLGAGTVFFLHSKLDSGVKNFFELSKIDEKIERADLVISGEGKIDEQTCFGKVVFQLRQRAANKKFVAFCGCNQLPNTKQVDFPIIEINQPNESLEMSIKNTKKNLASEIEKLFFD